MKKTRRASDTKAARGGFEEARIAARERTLRQTTAGRQFGKTRAKVIQSHTRARGQRNQARRDARQLIPAAPRL